MALLLNFVLDTTNAPGTAATINLAGAPAGRLSYAAFSSGTPAYYFMDDGTQSEWGYGIFTSGSPNTLTRNVIGNTAGSGSRLNFAGATRVYNEVPAERSVFQDPTGGVSLPGNLTMAGNINSASGPVFIAGDLAVSPGGATIANDSSVGQVALHASGFIQINPISPASGWTYLQFLNSGGLVGSITYTGSSTVAYNTSSDYRLKTNLRRLSRATARLAELPVYRFNWRDSPDGPSVDGVLAHEAAAVVPEAVIGEKDGDAMQQIDHSKLVPLLIAAVQELTKRVAALESTR